MPVTTDPSMGRITQYIWNLTVDGAEAPVLNPGSPDRTVQVTGTLGGGTLKLEGACQHPPTDWLPLHDPFGAELAFTSVGIALVLENPIYIRPVLSGSAGANIRVNLVSR